MCTRTQGQLSYCIHEIFCNVPYSLHSLSRSGKVLSDILQLRWTDEVNLHSRWNMSYFITHSGYLRRERHRIPPGPRDSSDCRFRRQVFLLGQRRSNQIKDVGSDGTIDHVLRHQRRGRHVRLRSRIRLVQRTRILQRRQQEPHLPASLLWRAQT